MKFLSRVLVAAVVPACVFACSAEVKDQDDDDAFDSTGSQSSSSSTTTGATSATGTGGGSTSSSSQASSGSGAGGATCFAGQAACDPLTNAPCGAGEACDLGVDGNNAPALSCFPPPNTQQLGEACDASNGPFCSGTLTCFGGKCAAFCCSADDCDAGVPCTPFDANLGSLGACGEAPTCGGPGASCSQPSDCCSNDCHGNHCH